MTEKVYRLALVTGAALRLGRAFALKLSRMGYAILLHFHGSQREAEETAAEIRSGGVPVFPVRADLTVAEEIETLFAVIDGLPHRLHLVVNSAAVMAKTGGKRITAQDWDAVLNLNLRAPFLVAQEAADRMVDGGLIVNIGDAGSIKTWTGYIPYIVSKSGLDTLTRLLAKAYAPRIRVNAIAPGLVLPSAQIGVEEWKKLVNRIPLQKPTSIEDICAALAYLVENTGVTGQTIVVDGGYTLV